MKTPRNTKELPISEAIAKLRALDGDAQKELTKATVAAAARIGKRAAKRREKILLRVPEELRDYVSDKGRAAPLNDASPPDQPTEAGQERPAWLDESPREPVTKPIVIDRSERRVPRQ